MVLIILLAAASVCGLIYYILTREMDYWEKRNVKGPKPTFFFGSIADSFLRRQPMPLVMRKLYDAYPQEKVVGIFRMKTPCLLVRDPDIIKQIMIKDFDQFMDRGIEFSKEGLGANLFHADGETWRILRNRLTPMFTSGKLKNMLYLIEQRGDSFIKHYDEIIRSKPEQDIKQLVQKYTMSSIAATAFGIDVEYNNKKMYEELHKIDKLIFNCDFSDELDMMFPGILKLLSKSLFPKSLIDFFKNLVHLVMKERNNMPTTRNDFMDLMLGMKKEGVVTRKSETKESSLEITESLMTAQAFVFYAAGYETSASTVSFMMYQLALNPDVQERLIAHVDEVLARHGGKTTYDCLSELTYMDRVFDETLRMYPIVDPLQRCAVNDYKIPDLDLTIKKGQTIIISTNGLHYDEKYYPNPQKFDPDRFTAENSRDRHPCVYMPFGIGPRNCIGSRFAHVQSKVFLTKFFSKYRIVLGEKIRFPMQYEGNKRILSAVGGIPVKIIPRFGN